MEPIIVWLLSVQLWTESPPKIALIYQKEFVSHEECMRERATWDEKKLVALCLTKVKNVGPVSQR